MANGDAKVDMDVEERPEELGAVLEGFLSYGDNMNPRVWVQGRWMAQSTLTFQRVDLRSQVVTPRRLPTPAHTPQCLNRALLAWMPRA